MSSRFIPLFLQSRLHKFVFLLSFLSLLGGSLMLQSCKKDDEQRFEVFIGLSDDYLEEIEVEKMEDQQAKLVVKDAFISVLKDLKINAGRTIEVIRLLPLFFQLNTEITSEEKILLEKDDRIDFVEVDKSKIH
ncbi:hypothetical protein [Sphingobacterium kyonggiense]